MLKRESPACLYRGSRNGVERDAIRIKHPGCKEGILGLPVPRSPKLGSTGVIAGRVPEWPGCAKNFLQKAQSPGIRGFGVYWLRRVFNQTDIPGLESVPDAGSWCIQEVHNREIYGDPNVGAGLLAKAVGQTEHLCLIHRIREQARSHMGFSVGLRIRRRRPRHHPHHQPSSPIP